MKKRKLVLFGLGRFAELAHLYFSRQSDLEPVAFTVDAAYMDRAKWKNLPVVPFEEIGQHYSPDDHQLFVAIAYTDMNELRAAKYAAAKRKGYTLASFVSPETIALEKPRVGENTFIFEAQVIQPGVRIGNNVILWSGNHLGHDVVIEDHCFIASHAVLSGYVHISEYSFIGVNVTIRDGVRIGRKCLIGAGTVILKHTRDLEVYINRGPHKFHLDSEAFCRKLGLSPFNP